MGAKRKTLRDREREREREEERQREREEKRQRERESERMTKENGTATMNGNGHAEPTKTSPTGIKMSKEVEELLLWEDPIKSGGILGGATVAYLLFHCSGYSALYIVCNLLLVGVIGTFVWSIIAQLLGKPEFPIPEPKPEAIDKAFVCLSEQGKCYTNKVIGVFYRIAKGHEPALSLKAAFALYILAKISSVFSILTMAFIAVVGAFAGPKIYVMYKEDIDSVYNIAKVKVDEVVGQAKDFVNEKVISKIKPPAKKTE